MEESTLFSSAIGCTCALASAVSWAIGSILFGKIGEKVSPTGMNLTKCLFGIALSGSILIFTGFHPVDVRTFLILGGSGLLGIALGDTLFFYALIYLGAKLTVLLGTLGPVFTVFIAIILLHEEIRGFGWLGIILTLAGVNIVLWNRSKEEKTKRRWRSGIICGLLSVICLSTSIIMTKVGVQTASAHDALFIRFLWAGVGLTIWGGARGNIRRYLAPLKDTSLLLSIFGTVLIIIFGGFYLFILSLKYIDASIATILNITDPIFVLPLSALIMRDRIAFVEVAGAIVAVTGVILILTNQ